MRLKPKSVIWAKLGKLVEFDWPLCAVHRWLKSWLTNCDKLWKTQRNFSEVLLTQIQVNNVLCVQMSHSTCYVFCKDNNFHWSQFDFLVDDARQQTSSSDIFHDDSNWIWADSKNNTYVRMVPQVPDRYKFKNLNLLDIVSFSNKIVNSCLAGWIHGQNFYHAFCASPHTFVHNSKCS